VATNEAELESHKLKEDKRKEPEKRGACAFLFTKTMFCLINASRSRLQIKARIVVEKEGADAIYTSSHPTGKKRGENRSGRESFKNTLLIPS